VRGWVARCKSRIGKQNHLEQDGALLRLFWFLDGLGVGVAYDAWAGLMLRLCGHIAAVTNLRVFMTRGKAVLEA
jgi:hypothetical protein